MSDKQRTANEIQWRNIRKVVSALADLCFESPKHPKYGTCHVALTTSLTAKDGLGPIELEPLPDTAALTAELAAMKAKLAEAVGLLERWLNEGVDAPEDGTAAFLNKAREVMG